MLANQIGCVSNFREEYAIPTQWICFAEKTRILGHPRNRAQWARPTLKACLIQVASISAHPMRTPYASTTSIRNNQSMSFLLAWGFADASYLPIDGWESIGGKCPRPHHAFPKVPFLIFVKRYRP